MSETGRFTAGTNEGDPDVSSYNYKILLYGHPVPGTSVTTIRVDGRDFYFDTSDTVITGNQIVSTMYTDDGLIIKQILSLVKNETTNRDDIVKISYEIENRSDATKNVGARMLYNYIKYKGIELPETKGTAAFADDDMVSGWPANQFM